MSVVEDRYLIFKPITGRDRLVDSCYILPRPRMFRLFTYLQLDREVVWLPLRNAPPHRFFTFSGSPSFAECRSCNEGTGTLVPGLGLAAADQAAG